MERHSLSGYVHYRSVLKPKISKSAYKEIKAYADINGVSLRNFKDYTGDITEIIEIIDKIKMVARDFPNLINNRYQVVLGLYFEESDEYAGTENHTVTLNGLYFNDSSETCKAYNEKVATGHFVKGTTYKDIIFHELGHVVCNTYKLNPLKIAKEVLDCKLDVEVAEYVADNLSLYSAVTFESIIERKGTIFDGSEIIAECFCAYYSDAANNEFANQFVTKCLKIVQEVES